MLYQRFLYISLILLFVACGSDDKKVFSGSAPQVTGAGGTPVSGSAAASPAPSPAEIRSPIAVEEIEQQNFFAAKRILFSNAVRRDYVAMPGTPQETRVARYSFFLLNNQIINPAHTASAREYCEIYVEADPALPVQEIFFAQNERLILGTFSRTLNPDQFTFTLSLQAGLMRQMSLFCKNIANVAGIQRHVSNYILVRTNP
jgi:hypothetical protein